MAEPTTPINQVVRTNMNMSDFKMQMSRQRAATQSAMMPTRFKKQQLAVKNHLPALDNVTPVQTSKNKTSGFVTEAKAVPAKMAATTPMKVGVSQFE